MDAAVAGSQLKPATAAADRVCSQTERGGDCAPASRLVAGTTTTASSIGTQLHPRQHHCQQQQQQQQTSPTDNVSLLKIDDNRTVRKIDERMHLGYD